MLGAGERVRYVCSPQDLVFYSDLDKSHYPIYISENNSIWIKKKPFRVENGVKVSNAPINASFYVKGVQEITEDIKHHLLEVAIQGITEITKEEPEVKKYCISYEVYKGDMERFVGEAMAYCIKVISCNTPFSGLKMQYDKAWAVGYDWRKRLTAKYPDIERYTYIKGESGRVGRAYVRIIIKLPIVTSEFERLFNAVIGTTTTQVSVISDLEKQIQSLQDEIKKREVELQALKQELESLQLKLQLEKAKEGLMG